MEKNENVDSRLSEQHMALASQQLSQIFQTWAFTTMAIFFGLFLLMRVLRGKKPTKPSEPITIVVDKKEGIRELNPNYTVPCDQSVACNSVIYESICEALLSHHEQHPDEPVFGSHDTPTSPYQWITYRQFFQMFQEFGSGLKHKFGVYPGSKTMMGIYAVNCVEWVTAHYGMLFYSNIAVPLYSTLGEEAMIHIVKLTKMSLCMCLNEERAESLLKMKNVSTLKNLVIMKPKSAETMAQLRGKFVDVQFHTFDEVREAGRGRLQPFVIPKENDMYVLNFTSGTTGVPKGVIITCGMFQHVIKSVLLSRNILNLEKSSKKWWMDQNDVYFSFLPLAHVLEQCLMTAAIFVRAKVGFFSGDMNKIMDDIGTLKPTMMALVPRLILRIYDATLVKLAEKHIPKFVLDYAVKAKLDLIAKSGKPVRGTFGID